jgi:hypothetical protein
MGRESGRRRNRREVQYKLNKGGDNGLQRRAMTEDEIQSFVRAIHKGLRNEFGLVKLSALDLDAMIPSPEDLTWATHTTLLNYASWRCADAVSGALLRAGADASARVGCEDQAGSKADASAALAELLPRAQVWVVNKVVAMRRDAALSGMDAQRAWGEGACMGCGKQQGSAEQAPDDPRRRRSTCNGLPVKWAECGHVTCEACLWLDLRATGRLACRCGVACREVQEEEEHAASWAERADAQALERKEESRRRWAALPFDIEDKLSKQDAIRNFKIPTFGALPPSEVQELGLRV